MRDDMSWVMWIYLRIERGVAALVLIGMVGVVAMATYSFFRTLVFVGLEQRAALDYAQFQTLFDRVLAAVIALELARSIGQMVAGDHGIAQLRTVIVIGMLAVVRKLIVLEVDQVTGPFLAGIAAAVVALAAALAALWYIDGRR